MPGFEGVALRIQVAELHDTALASKSKMPTVRREREGPDPAHAVMKRPFELAGRDVPEPDRHVLVSRGERSAVGRDRKRIVA